MSSPAAPGSYPGNPSLPVEVREKILATFRHTLNLFSSGNVSDCVIGCEFILKMDPRFTPARRLLEKARNPASAVDVAQLEAIVATTPTRQERVVAADPGRLLVRAVESFNARDFDAAIAAARNVLEVLPGNQDAREILEKATRKKASQPVFDASRERALAALESNRKEDARVELDKMRSLDPDHPAVALLERRIAPAAPVAAAAPPRAYGTVAKAVPPPPPNFGGLDLDLPEEPSGGGFGAETKEPEIQFDDNATVAMKIPSSMVSPHMDGGAAGGLDSLSLDSLSLDMPTPSAAVVAPAASSRGLTGPLQDSDAYSSAPSVSPGSPGDMWSDGGSSFDLEAEEPKAPVEPPVIHRAPAPAAAPMVDSLESVQEDFGSGEREIEGLLRQGDEAAARGDRQQAIEVWSRIFLIDINNTDAVVRIENAREQMAEGNRVISDGLKAGREKYEAGDLAGARELFLQVLAIDETEPTARFHLDRIEEDMARAAHAPEAEASKPAVDTAASAADAKPARAPRKAIRLSVQPRVLALIAVFAAMVVGLVYFFVLRPPRGAASPSAAGGSNAAAPRGSLATARQLLGAGKIAEARAELRRIPPSSPDRDEAQRMLAELGKTGPAESTGSAPAPAPDAAAAVPVSAVDADAAKLRVTAETALAEKRYIDALKSFSQAAPAFRNDPTFAQSMGAASEKVTSLTPAVKLYNEGEYETAIPVLWRIYQEDRENRDAKSYLFRSYFNQGVSQLQNGQYPKAIESFRESLTLEPSDAEALRHRKFAERYQKSDLDLMGRIYVRHLNHRP